MAFHLISAVDGTSQVVEAYGEALDGGDKATAKAMTAAYKSAMIQTFCIPVAGAEDPDRTRHSILRRSHVPEPVQGWEQWCEDIKDIIAVCESGQALDTVQDSNREVLKALSAERRHLYDDLGAVFCSRREMLLGRRTPKAATKVASKSGARKRRRATPVLQVQSG
jgi:hypothetical protein